MLFKPSTESNEVFIERIRQATHFAKRFRWPTRLFVAVMVLSPFLFLITSNWNPLRLGPLKTMPPEYALIMGISQGMILGALFQPLLSLLIKSFYHDRAEYLLLDYHDRLAQAGLLPDDAAMTINPAEPASSRS